MADLKRYLTNPSLIAEGFFRQISSYSVFQNKSEFKVKVLTNPVHYAGPDYESSVSGSTEPSSKWWFKGRILDSNMTHQKFLPDPCDNSIAADQDLARALVTLHSTIFSDGKPDCGVGDTIIAFIDPGDNSMVYNVQNLKYLKVDTQVFGGLLPDQECTALSQIDFGGGVAMGDMLTVFSPPPNGQFYSAKPASQLGDYQIPGSITPATTVRTSPYGPRRPPQVEGRSGGGSSKHLGIDFSGGNRSAARNSGAATTHPRYVIPTDPQYIESCRSIFDGVVKSVTYGGVTYTAGDSLYTNNGDVRRSGYGLVVKISHNVKDVLGNDRQIISVYAHLEYTDLVAGQNIKQGEAVGHIGSTGSSTGPHLHFEVQEPNAPSEVTGYGTVQRNGGTLSQRYGKYWDPTWILGWRYGTAAEHEEQDAEDVNYIEENHSEEQFEPEELAQALGY